MPRAIFALSATKDLDLIARYVARESGSLAIARALDRKLRNKADRLADLPGTLGTARPDLGVDLRSTPCAGYVIFFRYTETALEIVKVLHGSRDVVAYFGEDDSE